MQVYDADIVPLLLSTVHDLFENYHVKEFVTGVALRNEATFQAFLAECGKSGYFQAERKNQLTL